MISFHSPSEISSCLVRAKLYPLERFTGSARCGKKQCEVYINVKETDTLTSNDDNNCYKIDLTVMISVLNICLLATYVTYSRSVKLLMHLD